MIASLKSLLSVWVGIFLLLPGCLCEILAPFGIDLHPQSGRGVPLAMETAQSDGTPPFPCQCGEETPKRADFIDAEDEDFLRRVGIGTTPFDTAPSSAFPTASGFESGRSPPPTRIPWPVSERRQLLLGVFLI